MRFKAKPDQMRDTDLISIQIRDDDVQGTVCMFECLVLHQQMGRRTEPTTFLRRRAEVYGHTIWHLVHMT